MTSAPVQHCWENHGRLEHGLWNPAAPVRDPPAAAGGRSGQLSRDGIDYLSGFSGTFFFK